MTAGRSPSTGHAPADTCPSDPGPLPSVPMAEKPAALGPCLTCTARWEAEVPQTGEGRCKHNWQWPWSALGLHGDRAVAIAGQRGVCTTRGPCMTLSALLFTAQRREMSSATMETRGSLNPLSWRQVSLLCWMATGWGLLLWGHRCIFQRLGPAHISLLGLLFGCFMAYMTGCPQLRPPPPSAEPGTALRKRETKRHKRTESATPSHPQILCIGPEAFVGASGIRLRDALSSQC